MKRVTIQDIAKHCGVSPTVVSAVLNQSMSRSRCSKEKSELIRRTAQELCYHPNILARAMVSQHVPVVALMLYSQGDNSALCSDYFAEIAPTFIHAMEKCQLEVLVAFYRNEEEQMERFESLKNKGLIGGVASNLIPSSHHEILTAFRNSGMPYAVFGHAREAALNIRINWYYSFVAEYHKRFGTQRCYLMMEMDNKQVLYPYEDKKEYDQYSYDPILAMDKITANPENLILILGSEFYLRSDNNFAHPFILERENNKYLIPSGISYALYEINDGRCEIFASKLLSEWMRGKKPVEQEYCLPCSNPIKLFFADKHIKNHRS